MNHHIVAYGIFWFTLALLNGQLVIICLISDKLMVSIWLSYQLATNYTLMVHILHLKVSVGRNVKNQLKVHLFLGGYKFIK